VGEVKLRKNLLFLGLGVLLTAWVTFLLRKISGKFFQDSLSLALLFTGLGISTIVYGLVKRNLLRLLRKTLELLVILTVGNIKDESLNRRSFV
jgi:hypothetical protein